MWAWSEPVSRVSRWNIAPGFYRWRRRRLLRATVWLGAYVFVVFGLAWAYVWFPTPKWIGILAAFGGAILVPWVLNYLDVLRAKLRIAPYFEKTTDVGGPCTYRMGRALLQNSARLDAFLESVGQKPLGSFSSGDDFLREPLTWHSVAEALPSVDCLLSAVREGRLDVTEHAKLLSDLSLLSSKLRFALEANVRFCLLLGDDSGTSAQEHAMRVGTFFDLSQYRDPPRTPRPTRFPSQSDPDATGGVAAQQ